MDFKDKVILIVGASSGMGRVLALRLAEQGARLAITARRQEKLDSLAAEIGGKGGVCFVLAADAENEQAAEGVVAATVGYFGRIDLAVLNAGGAPALDMRLMEAREVNAYMRSNYDVVVNYLFPLVRQMKQQGGGLIAQTNSLAGFLGVPLQGPYSAAKGAARILFDTCRLEFACYGIKFLSLYPGFVATEATLNDGMPAPMEISEERAVGYMIDALRRERPDTLFPPPTSWLVRLAGILPKPVVNWIVKREVPPLPQ